MAESDKSTMKRVKNQISKIHDKLQTKCEDIYEDIQETVGRKKHNFTSHVSDEKDEDPKSISEEKEGQESKKNIKSSGSFRKMRFSKKIELLMRLLNKESLTKEDSEQVLNLSKSELSLLEKEIFSKIPESPDLDDDFQFETSKDRWRSEDFLESGDESMDSNSVKSFKQDVKPNLDTADNSSRSENEETVDSGVSTNCNASEKSTALSTTTAGHLMHPCEILELLGNRFPKLKEKSDQVQKYLQRSTRLYDVNKRLKCQIWSSVVTIVLVEAKGLMAMDQDTGSSDPYCKFRLGNEKYKSKVVWRSLNPCWLEQFDLHMYDDQEQLLELTVWDRDKQSKDDYLGRCVIDLSLLEREKTHSIKQNLEDSCGDLFLLLTISGTTSSETITDLTNYQDNPRERKLVEDRFAWHRLDIWNETGSGGVGWLCVKVFGAKGLAAADLGGKSDPFCVLELVNARLQTHTEYKTLAPNWMKIFTFNVKDITSALEITVYDEDHDHKVEFLGKLSVPLLNIQNGDKRWYSLKDKKMRARAKGNCPQILLEMTVIWNPIKACIRALNPREEKYMQTEIKFKRQVFLRNVMRLKSIIMWFIEIGKILQACFEWESRIRSFVALLGWIFACYYFEPWMAPFILLLLFGRNWLIFWLTGGSYLQKPIDDEELLAEEDDDDPEQDKEEKKSLKERLQAIQEVTQSVQNSIGYMASLGEGVKNLFNFTVPYLSGLAIILLFAASFVLFLIPIRYLLMLWGINKFARKILRPHTIPNNEVLDLLSRVPDDEDLLDFRELKIHSTTETRKDARKKHKAS